MRKLGPAILALAALLPAAGPAGAQIKFPPETRNAALRYWMAFADLQDPPADKATQQLLEKTAAGEAPWDEAKLGPILDRNVNAIQEMQRATKLPECDWGIEYGRGPRASIAPLIRARVLARLNTLYGMRMMAKGQTQDAVDSWLDGVRFAQDMAKGGTLIFKLISQMALLSDFQAMTNAAQTGRLSQAQRLQISNRIRPLQPGAFDWAEGLGLEAAAIDIFLEEMRQSKDPTAVYEELNQKAPPPDFAVPTPQQEAAFDSLIVQAQAALRLPVAEAGPRLARIQRQIAQLGEEFRDQVPSFSKINDARGKVEASRTKLLDAIAKS